MSDGKRWYLRAMHPEELDALYTERIEADFPSAERPSLSAMHVHVQKDLQKVLLLTDGEADVAYAVCAQKNAIVLVSLLAVYPQFRSSGYGTTLLRLLAEYYKEERAIVLEVEDPRDAKDIDEMVTRTKRIAFYEKSGYHILPDIDHVSFGVRLLVMALPLMDTMERIRASAVEDLQAVYHRILPQQAWECVVTTDTAVNPSS